MPRLARERERDKHVSWWPRATSVLKHWANTFWHDGDMVWFNIIYSVCLFWRIHDLNIPAAHCMLLFLLHASCPPRSFCFCRPQLYEVRFSNLFSSEPSFAASARSGLKAMDNLSCLLLEPHCHAPLYFISVSFAHRNTVIYHFFALVC